MFGNIKLEISLLVFLVLAVLFGCWMNEWYSTVTEMVTPETVHIKVYKDSVLLLEYTGKNDSWKQEGDSHSFTVDEKTYIFKDVDTVEVISAEKSNR